MLEVSIASVALEAEVGRGGVQGVVPMSPRRPSGSDFEGGIALACMGDAVVDSHEQVQCY